MNDTTPVAERGDLVELRGGPQMWIGRQPQPTIFDILGERVRRRTGTDPWGVFPALAAPGSV